MRYMMPKNMTKAKLSKLSVVSFVTMLLSGICIIVIECCLWLFGDNFDLAALVCIACIVILIFWPLLLLSFLGGLISIVKIIIKKQAGITYAVLTVVLATLLMIGVYIVELSPSEAGYKYGPILSIMNIQD